MSSSSSSSSKSTTGALGGLRTRGFNSRGRRVLGSCPSTTPLVGCIGPGATRADKRDIAEPASTCAILGVTQAGDCGSVVEKDLSDPDPTPIGACRFGNGGGADYFGADDCSGMTSSSTSGLETHRHGCSGTTVREEDVGLPITSSAAVD